MYQVGDFMKHLNRSISDPYKQSFKIWIRNSERNLDAPQIKKIISTKQNNDSVVLNSSRRKKVVIITQSLKLLT